MLDVGLATSYAVRAYAGAYYIELDIDEKSDVAKQSVKLFATQVLDRGDTAGEHRVDEPQMILGAVRAALAPAAGVELGARVLQLSPLSRDGDLTPRDQVTAVVDGRYERELGDGSRLTGYSETAMSLDGGDTREERGLASLAHVRLSTPQLDGAISARHYGTDYAPLGNHDTLYGQLRDELRLNATAYPTRWMPVSVFLSRQEAYAGDEGEPGVLQHAVGRLQLTHPSAPITSVQVGHSLLDDGLGGTTQRLRVVAQGDYDLATGVLSFLPMRRFLLRGLYGVSSAQTESDGLLGRTDRVALTRLEAKLAPTATETGYALFRSREVTGRDLGEGALELRVRHWEGNFGARSAFVPGLIPQLNHTVLFDEDRTTVGAETRRANATLSGQLGTFPGEWFALLAPVAIDTRYSVATDDRAVADVRASADRLRRLDNRMSYNGMERLVVDLQELYEVAHGGPDELRTRDRLELRNRVIYRVSAAAPVTLRVDFIRERRRNVDGIVGAPSFGRERSVESGLEWLVRWDRRWTTKAKGTYVRTTRRGVVGIDEAGGPLPPENLLQHAWRPELELRYLLQQDDGSLFLVQRSRVTYSRGQAAAALNAVGIEAAVGLIWSKADHLYLDAEVGYREQRCLRQPCVPTRVLDPRLVLWAKL